MHRQKKLSRGFQITKQEKYEFEYKVKYKEYKGVDKSLNSVCHYIQYIFK